MRIQTRLFLGTALLVLALMGTQWWLYQRQLESMEGELGVVAASVGKDLLLAGAGMMTAPLGESCDEMVWIDEAASRDGGGLGTGGARAKVQHDVRVVVIPDGDSDGQSRSETDEGSDRDLDGPEGAVASSPDITLETEVVADRMAIRFDDDGHAVPEALNGTATRRYMIKVVADEGAVDRFLVISDDDKPLHRIPIPVEPAVRSFRSTMRRGAAVGGILLVAGLVGAGVLANRVTRPLRDLADGAEAVGRGELGIQVPVTATGEVGELQRSFNAMSGRLAELEAERDRWREREHLAQLGDVSRGLAHTLRNPLNTLGLAVEELASVGGGRDDLVVTARSQIRRIDQWLRSFLALGAEDVAEPAPEDLSDITRAVVFEAVQQGASVDLSTVDGTVPVIVVASAVRAALANLLDNAFEVSPPGLPVEVGVLRDSDLGLVTIRDRGSGLPDEVRRRLFEPHVTTKVGGSGMGLFLARQLVVGMHGGVLEIADHPKGGTIATVKLPIADLEDGPDE